MENVKTVVDDPRWYPTSSPTVLVTVFAPGNSGWGTHDFWKSEVTALRNLAIERLVVELFDLLLRIWLCIIEANERPTREDCPQPHNQSRDFCTVGVMTVEPSLHCSVNLVRFLFLPPTMSLEVHLLCCKKEWEEGEK